MKIKDLMPWNRDSQPVPVRRADGRRRASPTVT
jgi:hypothetical protein